MLSMYNPLIEKSVSPDLTRASRIGLGKPQSKLGSDIDQNRGLGRGPHSDSGSKKNKERRKVVAGREEKMRKKGREEKREKREKRKEEKVPWDCRLHAGTSLPPLPFLDFLFPVSEKMKMHLVNRRGKRKEKKRKRKGPTWSDSAKLIWSIRTWGRPN